MKTDMIRIHHADYEIDIPFWKNQTAGLDPILEIGCGHGRVTLPLLASGRVMIGVDKDSEPLTYLQGVLEELDAEIRQRITLIQADILDYLPRIPIGGVIIPCNTYSTFNPEDRTRLIRKVHSCLKDGGVLLASLPNPWQTEEILAELGSKDSIESSELERELIHPLTGFPVQVSSRLRAARNSLLWDWIYDQLHPDGEVERVVVTVEHFLGSADEILGELREGGFNDIHCQGDFSGGEFNEFSPHLILICRK